MTDLLQLHDRTVTYMLASVAVAVLAGLSGLRPFALWLCGLTGAGKSFMGKLIQSFFGAFAGADALCHLVVHGQLPATPGVFLQGRRLPDRRLQAGGHQVWRCGAHPANLRRSHGPRPAESGCDHQYQPTDPRLAAGHRRGRARAQRQHPGPEHYHPCAAAGQKPRPRQSLYEGVPPLSGGHGGPGPAPARRGPHPALPATRPGAENYYYRAIAGQQNDSRIATNFALLAAGFFELASYLGMSGHSGGWRP